MVNIDELIRYAVQAEYSALTPSVDAFCRVQQISFTAFSEQFARRVALSYQQRTMPWLDADTAMNNLHAQAMLRAEHTRLSDFAFAVYLAFDAAEYHPKMPHLSSDEISRPLIDTLLTRPVQATAR